MLAEVGGRRGALWFLIDSGNLRGTLIDARIPRESLPVVDADFTVLLRVGPRSAFRSTAHLGDFVIDGALGTDLLQRGPVALASVGSRHDVRSAPRRRAFVATRARRRYLLRVRDRATA